jgi:hypothetical protein
MNTSYPSGWPELAIEADPLETVYVVYDPDEAPCGDVFETLEEAAGYIEAYLDGDPAWDGTDFAEECSITEMQMRRSERDAVPEWAP